jgi:hypothetical protein
VSLIGNAPEISINTEEIGNEIATMDAYLIKYLETWKVRFSVVTQ